MNRKTQIPLSFLAFRSPSFDKSPNYFSSHKVNNSPMCTPSFTGIFIVYFPGSPSRFFKSGGGGTFLFKMIVPWHWTATWQFLVIKKKTRKLWRDISSSVSSHASEVRNLRTDFWKRHSAPIIACAHENEVKWAEEGRDFFLLSDDVVHHGWTARRITNKNRLKKLTSLTFEYLYEWVVKWYQFSIYKRINAVGIF